MNRSMMPSKVDICPCDPGVYECNNKQLIRYPGFPCTHHQMSRHNPVTRCHTTIHHQMSSYNPSPDVTPQPVTRCHTTTPSPDVHISELNDGQMFWIANPPGQSPGPIPRANGLTRHIPVPIRCRSLTDQSHGTQTTGVIGSSVPRQYCPTFDAITWVITFTE